MRLSAAVLLFLEGVAAACGAATVSRASVAASAQRILLSVRGGKTEIVLQVVVPRSPADYGALIPLPAQPVVDPVPVDAGELAALDRATQIEIVAPSSDGGGCGCLGGAGDAAGGNGGVLVETVDIGPVTAATLRGEDAAAVNAWLADNGFVIPEAQRALVAVYTGPGRTFLALRRNGATVDAPDSLGVHLTLDGDQRGLPMRFTTIGAGARLGFTIFVAAAQAAGPSSPYATVLVTQIDRDAALAGYGDAVAAAVAARGARAFVAEYRGPVPPLGTRLSALVDSGQTLTRYSTMVAPSQVTADADFYGAAPAMVPTTISARPRTVPWALALFAGALVWAGRETSRRARTGGR